MAAALSALNHANETEHKSPRVPIQKPNICPRLRSKNCLLVMSIFACKVSFSNLCLLAASLSAIETILLTKSCDMALYFSISEEDGKGPDTVVCCAAICTDDWLFRTDLFGILLFLLIINEFHCRRQILTNAQPVTSQIFSVRLLWWSYLTNRSTGHNNQRRANAKQNVFNFTVHNNIIVYGN